jgi:alpha-beta hydrolase superfamily lysophospholipase
MPGVSSTTRTVAAADGTPILVREWPATGADATWAGVLIVHGLAEHSGRYEHVGDWMAADGLRVTGYDLRGFGASGGRRAWTDRWSRHHDDLEERLLAIRAEAPDRPLALYGHSMGALVALGYVVADPPRPLPDVLVLSAPATDSSLPGWQKTAAPILARVAPTLEIKNAFDGTILSRDPSVAERYLADTLNYHRTTTRLGAEALAEQRRVLAATSRLSLITLVIHGGDDRLVPTASSAHLAELPTVTRRVHEGLRHESHNEPEGEQVIAGVVAWLRSVLESTDN